MPGAPFPLAGEVAALSSSLLWACAGIVFRRLRGRASPAAINLAKNTTAAGCFAVVGLALWGAPWPVATPLAAQGLMALSGIVGLSVCDTYFLRAIQELGPRRATLLMLLSPLLVFAGAALPPSSETAVLADPARLAAVLVALTGIALAASEAPAGGTDPAASRRGILDGLLAAVFQAAGVLLARAAFAAGAGPVDGAMVRLAVGAAVLALAGAATGRLSGWARELGRPATLRTLVPTAFFGTFLGIGAYQCALAWGRSAGIASTLNSLAPVWLIPLSAVFLGERHGVRAWASTALALGGVAWLALAG